MTAQTPSARKSGGRRCACCRWSTARARLPGGQPRQRPSESWPNRARCPAANRPPELPQFASASHPGAPVPEEKSAAWWPPRHPPENRPHTTGAPDRHPWHGTRQGREPCPQGRPIRWPNAAGRAQSAQRWARRRTPPPAAAQSSGLRAQGSPAPSYWKSSLLLSFPQPFTPMPATTEVRTTATPNNCHGPRA